MYGRVLVLSNSSTCGCSILQINSWRIVGHFFQILFKFYLCGLSTLSISPIIGNEHGRIVEKVSNQLSIKKYVLYCFCSSLVLSVVKYFRFKINDADLYRWTPYDVFETIDEYPTKFSTIDNLNFLNFLQSSVQTRGVTWAFIIINCLSDILNYPTFLVICLVLDIVTAVELRKTLSQKISTSKQVEEEKEEAIFKSTLLVVLNALSNFLLKLPMTINSIFEIIASLGFQSSVSSEYFNPFFYFFIDLNGGDFFESVANFLYFLAISLNCVFYYNFDRMFKLYFRKLFFKETVPSPVSSSTQITRTKVTLESILNK
jgi:hypothetical protein